MTTLFDRQFVEAISHLRLRSPRVPRGGRHADKASRQLGGGMEFRDYRPYLPGDDIRRIDWNLYRRSGRIFLRLFEELQDLPVYVLLDVSDSMFFESPPRADAARQMAAALMAAAMNQQDSPGLYPFGQDLLPGVRSVSSPGGFTRLLTQLESMRPAGPTHLEAAARRFASLRLRRGLVVVISDFFDARGIEAVRRALSSIRHHLLLIQVTRPSDRSPNLSGQLRLVDCEYRREIDVTVTSNMLSRYRQAYEQFQAELSRLLTRLRAGYMVLDADRPVLDQLGRLFVNGVLAVPT